jgi:hypothetical protein
MLMPSRRATRWDGSIADGRRAKALVRPEDSAPRTAANVPSRMRMNQQIMRWAKDTEVVMRRLTPMGLNPRPMAGPVRQIQGRDGSGDPKAKASTKKEIRGVGMPQGNPVLRLHQT